jgi:AcrR family transcriptional regulator
MIDGEEPSGRAAQRAASARRILAAARDEFAVHGYDATTIRAVARRAEVDPSLVIQHFGSKAALFRSAIQLDPAMPATAADHLLEVVSARTASLPPEMAALVRSMLTVPEATAAMKQHLDERVANLAAGLGGPDAELRAAVAVSTILGLTVARHFLELDALTGASEPDIARVVGRLVEADPKEEPNPGSPTA